MTLPEQSDRAVAQTREFLVRLASPYVENGIKGIRREVRDEASRLLRHYPYVWSDEKRGVDDMTGASDIVTRLRNWRAVHLARLHLLMEEAADEMAILQSDNSRRADLEAGLRDGVEQLQAEVERLRQVLFEKNHCPDPDNASRQDILTDAEREAIRRAIFRCTVSARARRLSGMDDLADEDRKDAEAFSGFLKRIG
jgi:hypothetical protein